MSDMDSFPLTVEEFPRFPSCTSKQAREHLPALVDQVVDSGEPVVIKKLNAGRAALFPARNLWMYEFFVELGMDKARHGKSLMDLMREAQDRLKDYLPEGGATGVDLVEARDVGNGKIPDE